MSKELSNAPTSADLDDDISAQLDALLLNADGDALDETNSADKAATGESDLPSDLTVVPQAATDRDTSEVGTSDSPDAGPVKEDPSDINETVVGALEAMIASPALDRTAPSAEQVDTHAQPPGAVKQLTGAKQIEPLFDQVDQLLADHAEQAVAGDFETVSEVTADQKQTQPADESQTGMAEQLQGSYFAPEQLLGGALEPTAVIDEDGSSTSSDTTCDGSQAQACEPNREPTSAADAVEAPLAESTNLPIWRRLRPGMAELAHQALPLFRPAIRQLRWACALANRPLVRLAPSTRNFVGYAGLVTLCNAGIVTVGKLLFILFGA